MVYVWINPVTDSMYETDVLNEFLVRHGYQRFYTSGDWLTAVKEKYGTVVREASVAVMDVRCPKTREVVEKAAGSNVIFPDIRPILIHCGQEGSSQEALTGEEKIITTPCQVLADMGNALGLPDTRFVPWNQFLASIGSIPECLSLKRSPIPPGFFEELGVSTVSLTGEEEIREYFQKGIPEDVQLVEMLYCKEGCHNGDGILWET